MEFLVKSVISVLAVGVLFLVILVQRDSLMAAKARQIADAAIIAERDTTIKGLEQIAVAHRKSIVKLQADQRQIVNTVSERERHFEHLQRQQPSVRHWAESALPDAVARLRERPAAIGADTYRQRLPTSDALPAGGSSADD